MLNLSAKIALIAALTSFSVVYAQKTEQTASVSPQEVPATLTGEWFGVRTRLRNAGINVTGNYTSEFVTNATGGVKHDATETGQFSFGTTIDTRKLFGLKGGLIQFTTTDRRGDDLDSLAQLNVIQDVQEVFGRGRVWRLTEFWYQQELPLDFDIKLGRTTQGTDFARFSCDFQNLSLCGSQAGSIAGDYWYNYPVSVAGARLRLKKEKWYVIGGAYSSNPHNLDENFAFSHTGATGVLTPLEFGWSPKLGSDHLPGKYRIGGWYDNSKADDVLLGQDHRPTAITGLPSLIRDGRYGGYFMFEQQLFGTHREDPLRGMQVTHGINLFLNVTQTDRYTEETDNEISIGLFYTGPFKARPTDDLAFAVSRTNINSRAALNQVLANPGLKKPVAEYETELYYSLHVKRWFILRPNIQYVADPSGLKTSPNVVAFGVKSVASF
jgi:porin